MIPPAILGAGAVAGAGFGTDAAGRGGGVGPPNGGGAIGATGKFAGASSNILWRLVLMDYELRIFYEYTNLRN